MPIKICLESTTLSLFWSNNRHSHPVSTRSVQVQFIVVSGDFTKLELFTKYYDSLYSLMDDISPGYRERFGEKLSQRLQQLEVRCVKLDLLLVLLLLLTIWHLWSQRRLRRLICQHVLKTGSVWALWCLIWWSKTRGWPCCLIALLWWWLMDINCILCPLADEMGENRKVFQREAFYSISHF